MSDKWLLKCHRFLVSSRYQILFSFVMFDWIKQTFSPLVIFCSNKFDRYLLLQMFILLRKTVHIIKWHQMRLLPLSLQSGTDGALVIGCFMTTAHTPCLKQTSWIINAWDVRLVLKHVNQSVRIIKKIYYYFNNCTVSYIK